MKIRKIAYSVGLVIAAGFMQTAQATEGGGSIYPMGAENYLSGALPPPGVYVPIYGMSYHADKLKDNNGNKVPVDFKVTANVIAPRLVWVTNNTFLGGQIGHAIMLPLVNLDVNVAGQGQSKNGIGDIDLTPIVLGFHHSPNLHSIVGLDIMIPSGGYNKNDMTNIGRNYWAIQPVYTASYIDPKGWNADFKLMFDYNFKNNATDYRSGHELHVDYSAGYAISKNWIAGIGGYAYQQVTDDELHGVKVANNKGRAFAIGPSIKYDNGKGMFITAKFQQEMNVYNRAEGYAFWLKMLVPF